MPKEPRKYKQYLWNDQIPMPKSTKYFKRKNQTILINNSQVSEINNTQVSNFSIDHDLNFGNLTYSENSLENQNQNQSDLESDCDDSSTENENETIINNTYVNDNNHLDEQNIFSDLIEAFSSEEIT